MSKIKLLLIQEINWFVRLFEMVPYGLVALFARLAIAPVFWRSGRTKVDGFMLNDSAVTLFEYEYKIPFPEISAHLAAFGEHFFPVLLVLGLGTRFAALALFIMTIVIQFVYPLGWWSHHALWFAILAFLVVRGGGVFSLDHLIKQKYRSA